MVQIFLVVGLIGISTTKFLMVEVGSVCVVAVLKTQRLFACRQAGMTQWLKNSWVFIK
jgi:hypothetical protein